MRTTGVTVTTLMPGPIETGFAAAGHLMATKLFAPGTGADPAVIAKAGYAGMLQGKLNVVAGLPWWMQATAKTYPILPKRLVLKVVEQLQRVQKWWLSRKSGGGAYRTFLVGAVIAKQSKRV